MGQLPQLDKHGAIVPGDCRVSAKQLGIGRNHFKLGPLDDCNSLACCHGRAFLEYSMVARQPACMRASFSFLLLGMLC